MPTRSHALTFVRSTLVFGGVLMLCGAASSDEMWPGRHWPTASPAEMGMDAAKLAALAQQVGGRGCVIRHGALVHSWGDIAGRGDVASAAKPVYAHFILKAVEDGRIPGLDSPVRDFEPRLDAINAALGHKDRAMTWRHMVNQTACYGVSEAPGTAYDYNDWHMALLFDTLLLRVYGASHETMDDEVLRPLLAEVIGCEDSPTFLAFGAKDRPGRLGISPRDFARFGLLYLREGRWNGTQVLSPEAVAMATRSPLSNAIPRTTGAEAEMIPGQRSLGSKSLPDNQTDHLGSYSFLWWTNGVDREGRRNWPKAPHDTFGAFGHGGRRAMVVIPNLDAIVSWNDARVDSREAQDRALQLLTEACTDRDPMFDQVTTDPSRPGAIVRKHGQPLVLCGPGDPEDFLYRGALRPDGTRDGDQMQIIRKLAATGANCLYVQAIRSHGGDGDATQNPFIDHDPGKGLDERLLDQWEQWFAAADEADICMVLFIYDDSVRVWNTGDDVGQPENHLLRTLAARFGKYRNVIWCVAEEYQEALRPERVRKIAAILKQADPNRHPVAVHKLDGLDFAEFADDPNIDQFSIQRNAQSPEELHEGLVKAWIEAGGRYSLNMSECAGMGTGSSLRRWIWACAMAGVHVMVLQMDVAGTPPDDLYACGYLRRFLERSDFSSLAPHDELALGDTDWVLAAPGDRWLAFSSHAETGLGLRNVPAGRYSVDWMDCASGREFQQTGVSLAAGDIVFERPATIGPEAVVRVRRHD
ncbi:MAG: serine hydrolase [Armatimonadetes bacterium]|nr:serine hydrolase [Armatimonadota bacterium]